MNVQPQTPPWPTAPRVRARDIDPIVLQIVEGTLNSIEAEIEYAIERTARSPMIREAHDYRVGKNADGMDPNGPFHDRIRFQHLQILPIPSRRNCRWQHPASAGPAQLRIDPDCPGHRGVVSRSLATSGFLEQVGGAPVAVCVVRLLLGSDGSHPDWTSHVLRRSAAPRAVLAHGSVA